MRVFFMLLLFSMASKAQTLTATGSWALDVSTVKPTVAGANYPGAVESSTNQTIIGVTESVLVSVLSKYDIYIKMSGTLPTGAKLFARRTADGTAGALLGGYVGGTAYLELSASNQKLFTINILAAIGPLVISFQSIPIQYKIEGLSVTQPTGIHTVVLTYTVTK
jgi:hypothetical protein